MVVDSVRIKGNVGLNYIFCLQKKDKTINFTFFVTYGNWHESSLVSLLVSSIMARLSCNVPVLLPLWTVNVLCGKISIPGTTFRRRLVGRLCFQHVNIMHTNNNANKIPPSAIRPTRNTRNTMEKKQRIPIFNWILYALLVIVCVIKSIIQYAYLSNYIDIFHRHTIGSIHTPLQFHRNCRAVHVQCKHHDNCIDCNPLIQPNKCVQDTVDFRINPQNHLCMSMCMFHVN